jgi:hypothetical protein
MHLVRVLGVFVCLSVCLSVSLSVCRSVGRFDTRCISSVMRIQSAVKCHCYLTQTQHTIVMQPAGAKTTQRQQKYKASHYFGQKRKSWQLIWHKCKWSNMFQCRLLEGKIKIILESKLVTWPHTKLPSGCVMKNNQHTIVNNCFLVNDVLQHFHIDNIVYFILSGVCYYCWNISQKLNALVARWLLLTWCVSALRVSFSQIFVLLLKLVSIYIENKLRKLLIIFTLHDNCITIVYMST